MQESKTAVICAGAIQDAQAMIEHYQREREMTMAKLAAVGDPETETPIGDVLQRSDIS